MGINLSGWTRSSTRFIDAPSFAWTPIAGVFGYRVVWKAGTTANSATTGESRFDFSRLWDTIPLGPVEWSITPLGTQSEASNFTFHRVPGFDRRDEPPLDWAGSARRNIDFLLSLPPDPETGEPLFLTHSWHLEPADIVIAYPCLHYPSFVALFLEALKHETDVQRRASYEAMLEATASAIMKWRTPGRGAAPSMPLTTRILQNPGAPRAEQGTITAFRAARMGEALLALYGWHARTEYLDYALHIARILKTLQRPDGSWPYRIRPETGEVTEEYTSGGISTAAFYGELIRVTGKDDYTPTLTKAVQWTLKNPCQTMRWQGMYEDVGEHPPFGNLENWDTLDAIVYLCRNRERIEGAVKTAERLNKWVEDQFVIFGPAGTPSCAYVHPPAVMEQYFCYYPMEAHTARWIRALLLLHQATDNPFYRMKAVRAANAIVRAQYPDGRYSTWGIDTRTGKPFNSEGDWYGCNAIAAEVLLGMSS
jgi:hypothetical protein